MKKIAPLVAAMLLSTGTGTFAQERPSLARFDEDVAVFRRVVRQYCAIVQDLIKQKEPDVAAREKAMNLLADAAAKWAVIQETYRANPPSEYARDPTFKARLQDITNACDDMRKALAAGETRRSLLACGFSCGLFVTLHEENGLTYAMDKLFHLRKTGKTAVAVFQTGGLDAVRPLLPALLRQRDDVLLAPLPWPAGDPRNGAYLAATRELSAALDRLALAATQGESAQAGAVLAEFMTLVNKPYGLAL